MPGGDLPQPRSAFSTLIVPKRAGNFRVCIHSSVCESAWISSPFLASFESSDWFVFRSFFAEKPAPDGSYLGPLVVGIFAGALFLPGLGLRDFWAPGEPIYGEILRVMHDRAEWLVPRLNGQLYADKPILYFWLALICARIAGKLNEFTARLPAALGGIGLVLTTYYFGKRFYHRQAGFVAAMVLATCSRMLWESQFLRLDTVLSFFLFLGFYFFVEAFGHNAPRNRYLFAYICFSLATLTKGPIGIVLPAFAAVILIVTSRRWTEIREMRLPSGFLILCAFVAPWLWLLHLNGEDRWLRDFIWIHNIQNFALDPIGHVQPFYYYAWNLPIDFLPWTVLVPGALVFFRPWKDKLDYGPTRALLAWFAAVFIFFSFSRSKIAYYLLPLLPSVALFVGCYTTALLRTADSPVSEWPRAAAGFYLLPGIFAGAGIAAPMVVWKIGSDLLWAVLPPAGVLIAGSVAVVVFLRRKNLACCLMSSWAILLAVSLIASTRVLPLLNRYKSPRPIGWTVQSEVPSDTRVYVFRSTMADFNYYSQRNEIPVVESVEQLESERATNCYLIINERDLRKLDRVPDFAKISEHQVGERKWYVLKLL